MITKLNSHLEEIVEKREEMMPLCTQINITGKCINTCAYCQKITSPQQDLDIDRIKDVIDDCVDMGIKNIIISGGEPFLNRRLNEILKYIKDKEIFTSLITSATVLHADGHENSLENIARNLDILNISFDAFTSKTYRQTRGNGNLETVKRFIQKANELKDNYRFTYNIWTVLSNLNEQEIGVIKQYVATLKNVDKHGIYGVKSHDQFMIQTPTGYFGNCWYIFINSMILHDGSVGMCCKQLMDNEDYKKIDRTTIPGNIYEQRFKDIWQSEKAKEIRKMMFEKRESYCRECDRGVEVNQYIQRFFRSGDRDELIKIENGVFI